MVADLAYVQTGVQVGPLCVSVQLQRLVFIVGSIGIHCCHFTVLLNSLLEIDSHQFLKSWLILILDHPFLCAGGLSTVCVPSVGIRSFSLAQLVFLLAVPIEARLRERNPHLACCHQIHLPTGPFCEHVWQKYMLCLAFRLSSYVSVGMNQFTEDMLRALVLSKWSNYNQKCTSY